jgi:hypothetical protein
LWILENTPSSQYVKAGTSNVGTVIKNEDGFWLRFADQFLITNYVWLSKSDMVKRS